MVLVVAIVVVGSVEVVWDVARLVVALAMATALAVVIMIFAVVSIFAAGVLPDACWNSNAAVWLAWFRLDAGALARSAVMIATAKSTAKTTIVALLRLIDTCPAHLIPNSLLNNASIPKCPLLLS